MSRVENGPTALADCVRMAGGLLCTLVLACSPAPAPEAESETDATVADTVQATAPDTATGASDTIAAAPASEPVAVPVTPGGTVVPESPKLAAALRAAMAAQPAPDSLLVLITSRPPLNAEELGALTDALLNVRSARGDVATAMASPAALMDLIESDRIVYIELSRPQPAAR